MMAEMLKWATILCWATAAGFFAWYAAGVARQITYVTLADGRRQERRLPLLVRLLRDEPTVSARPGGAAPGR